MPADIAKASDAPDADLEALGAQKFTFQLQVAAVPSQRAAGANHTVARGRGVVAAPHDVADRAPRARPPGQIGHVAVGGHAPGGDLPHRRQHARSK